MAMTVSNVLRCPQPHFSRIKCSERGSASTVRFSSVRFPRMLQRNYRLVYSAATAAGSSGFGSEINPYEILGVRSVEGFDGIKAAYTRKRKEAERIGDEFTVSQLEMAYDKLMMSQLTNRKKGLTFGSIQVPKDIRYADREPLVPWGPRSMKSSVEDIRINMAIAAFFSAWIFIKGNAEWKPLQFLAFVFVYRIFDKLKANEKLGLPMYNEDDGQAMRMGKRLLRSLSLVFGCIAVSSLAFTGVLNLIEILGRTIPAILYNNQEIFVTSTSALMLYILSSYYR